MNKENPVDKSRYFAHLRFIGFFLFICHNPQMINPNFSIIFNHFQLTFHAHRGNMCVRKRYGHRPKGAISMKETLIAEYSRKSTLWKNANYFYIAQDWTKMECLYIDYTRYSPRVASAKCQFPASRNLILRGGSGIISMYPHRGLPNPKENRQ